MLTLTDDAVSAIRTLTTQTDLPDETGLRIAATAEDDGAEALGLSVATGPQPDDQVVETHGARVYVDSAVAPALEDKALDAAVDDQGAAQFHLANQA